MDSYASSNEYYENINKQCCCFNLRKITRAVTQLFDHCLEKIGIRATQFTLLVTLASTHAKTLTDIADELIMDRTTLTRNLKPLERNALIKSIITIDKRAKSYALTDKGHAVLNQALPLWEITQNNLVELLGQDRYHNLLGELNKLLSVSWINKV